MTTIADLRNETGLSRARIAALASISEPTMKKIEEGDKTVKRHLIQRVLDAINKKLLEDGKITERYRLGDLENIPESA